MKTRKRPAPILDPREHARARRRWRAWLSAVRKDLRDLCRRQAIFWELQNFAKAHPAILTNGAFFDFVCRSHLLATTVAVSSWVDLDRRSH